MENGITLCDYLPHIDFVMSMGLISDVDIRMNCEQYAVMIRKSKSHKLWYDNGGFKDVIAMAAAVRGFGTIAEEAPCGTANPVLLWLIHLMLLTSYYYVQSINYPNYANGGGGELHRLLPEQFY